MIVSFGSQGSADVFNGLNTKAARRTCPPEVWPIALRRLEAIDAAQTLGTLNSPGANLEKLKGNLAGFYSVRINDQYRVIFHFDEGNASDVEVVDYH